MTASKLVRPSVDYKESFLEALTEYQKDGRMLYLDPALLAADFQKYVDELNTERGHLHKPYPDYVEPVPETVLWMVKDDKYIGSIDIRHRINWHLEKRGGHVQFIIRPSMRGKGYGKKLLKKAIPYMSHLGLENVLMTIVPENAIARHIVESCGAVLEDTTQETERFPARARYWLKID